MDDRYEFTTAELKAISRFLSDIQSARDWANEIHRRLAAIEEQLKLLTPPTDPDRE